MIILMPPQLNRSNTQATKNASICTVSTPSQTMDKAAIERVEQRKHAKITVRHLGQTKKTPEDLSTHIGGRRRQHSSTISRKCLSDRNRNGTTTRDPRRPTRPHLTQ
jgi:hypothetical protein